MQRSPPQDSDAEVPAVPGPLDGDAVRSVSVTRACERELCWFMAVAAVARLLLPRFSIWRTENRAGLLRRPRPRWEYRAGAWRAAWPHGAPSPGATTPDWARPSG